MATDPPADLTLTPINGESRTVKGWVTTFQLAAVVLDPFTNESAWLIATAGRILTHFSGADCRAAFIITGTAEEARQFLGPWATTILTFADPTRAAVSALGLQELPAFVQIQGDLHVASAAEGWDPPQWRAVAASLAKAMSWSSLLIPEPQDPSPYAGAAAGG